MSEQGATLQLYNNELVVCIEELKSKRDELQQKILKEEGKKAKLQHEIRVLSEQLSQVNENLSSQLETRDQYDKLIAETEQAYTKIVQSSQALLTVVKTEATHLIQKHNAKVYIQDDRKQEVKEKHVQR